MSDVQFSQLTVVKCGSVCAKQYPPTPSVTGKASLDVRII